MLYGLNNVILLQTYYSKCVCNRDEKKCFGKEKKMAVVTVTMENFQNEIMESEQVVLIDFWASWCGPCKMVSPIIDEIADENPSIKVAKVNVDEQPALAARFQVMSIPTLVVMKDGKIVNQSAGAKPKQQILDMLG